MVSKFLIPLCGTATEHAIRIVELGNVLESQPERLLIVLAGSGGLHPDAVLAYLDILEKAECEKAVISYANLFGADFALWLGSASLREIRPRSWVYVPEASAFSESEQQGGVDVMPLLAASYSWDYASCLDLIAEHVDLELVLGKRLFAQDLQELFLLNCDYLTDLGIHPFQSENSPDLPCGGLDNDRGDFEP